MRSDGFSAFLKKAMSGDEDVAAILQLLQAQVGQPTTPREPIVARRTEGGNNGPDVGSMVDYMNYDGDPNMGLLKGLFGGRAEPGTNDSYFYDRLGKRKRGR